MDSEVNWRPVEHSSKHSSDEMAWSVLVVIRLDKSGKQTILRPFDVGHRVAFRRETDFDVVDVVVNVRLASLALDVEFVASGRRTALGVTEPFWQTPAAQASNSCNRPNRTCS